MIFVDGNTYTVMIHNKAILDFPSRRKVMVDIENNWLYQVGTTSPVNSSEKEGGPYFTNHVVRTAMEEDIVPSPTHPTQNEASSSNDNQKRWEWLQAEIQGIKVEKTKQGVILDDV